jgi:hypothetical protein
MLLATGHHGDLHVPAKGVNVVFNHRDYGWQVSEMPVWEIFSRFNGLLLPEITHTLHTHGSNIGMSGAYRNGETQSGVDILRF